MHNDLSERGTTCSLWNQWTIGFFWSEQLEQTFVPLTAAARERKSIMSQYEALIYMPLPVQHNYDHLPLVNSCLNHFIRFVQETMKVSAPLLIGRLLSYFQPEPAISRTDAYITAALLSLVSFTEGILHAPTFFLNQRCGLHLRIATGSLVYRKVSTSSLRNPRHTHIIWTD